MILCADLGGWSLLHPLAVAVVGVGHSTRGGQPVLGVVGEGVTAVVIRFSAS